MDNFLKINLKGNDNVRERISLLNESVRNGLAKIKSLNQLNKIKTIYLGKNGLITELSKELRFLSEEEKKVFGEELNKTKNYIERNFYLLKNKFEEDIIKEKVHEENIDISLPSTNIPCGRPSIIENFVEDVENFFIANGYDVLDGPEIETVEYNFDMLNLSEGHPSREYQSNFYLKEDELLLRSQTSPVQVRALLNGKGKIPLRIICPGKTYRRDNINRTHEQEFVQIEGMVIDKNISLSDLKGTFNLLIKRLFGDNIQTRFKPSYYQFTSPSVEMCMSCFNCNGKGCSICKYKGWITISGGGMVHPTVLKKCGYDPNEWQGFSFGLAAEITAMLKYRINDIRVFHENDLREVKQFENIYYH